MPEIDPRVTAFRKAVQVLQADPAIRRTVEKWHIWDGSATSDDPLPAGMTTVRLTPFAEAEEDYALLGGGKRSVRSPVLVRVESRTRGLFNMESPVNLHGYIEEALATPEATAALRAAGVSWVEYVTPPDPSTLAEETAMSAFRLMVFIQR